MTVRFTWAVLAAGLALAGCARTCPAGLARMDGVQMFFGGSLSDADWTAFAAGVLTPTFPDGLTTYEAAGQWRDPSSGLVVREHTRVVQVFGDAMLARAHRVAEAYRVRFRQHSVGVVEGEACGGF